MTTAQPGRPVLLAVLFWVLTGVFAMHVLATHGLTCGIGSPSGHHHDRQVVVAASPAGATTAIRVVAVVRPADGLEAEHLCGVLGLCMSIAAVTFLLRNGRGTRRSAPTSVRRARHAGSRAMLRIQHRPAPSLTSLCVHRC